MMNPAVVRRDLLLLRNAPSMRPPAHNINSNAARVLCAQARRAMGLVLLIILLCGTAAHTAMAENRLTIDWNLAEDCDTTIYLVTFFPAKKSTSSKVTRHCASSLRTATPPSLGVCLISTLRILYTVLSKARRTTALPPYPGHHFYIVMYAKGAALYCKAESNPRADSAPYGTGRGKPAPRKSRLPLQLYRRQLRYSSAANH